MSRNNKFQDWIVYQIYPRSFKDSNGDGIGDLKGITSKLDHLTELGINAVWLSPCYKSPNCDNGYDISDYRDIMDEFGTLDDWKEMIDGMHARGIKLVMDFVGNHTSSEHKWFKEARKSKDNPYHDYYIWRDKPIAGLMSEFGGSPWEFNEETGEYYLHSFAIGQPDLDWTNPKVRKEMCDIIDYWVDLGVDGFRCDVLAFISKDLENGINQNGPKLHEYIRELFGREKVKHIFTVGECSMGEDKIVDICGADRDELTCIFQFDHFSHGRLQDKFVKMPFKYEEVRNDLVRWQYFTEKNDLIYTLLTDNHDQAHMISRLGNDKEYRYECATMYAAMIYLLKGVPFIYQGQEYGSPDPHYDDISHFNDIETLNYYNEKINNIPRNKLIEMINFGSRDNTRRPMCWNSEKNYGFSVAEKTWTDLHSRGAEINLERDKNSDKSVFCFYKKVIALRKSSKAARCGKFCDLTVGDGYFAYSMTFNDELILVVCNFNESRTVNGLPEYGYLFGNYGSARNVNGSYKPFETAVYKK
ncbi:MAG: alpha-glucosidase [Muribaculaceae bacterium]|nr:alpha-glucosidase [Muribaculaceae bacterium]